MQVVTLNYWSGTVFHKFFSHTAFILVPNTGQCQLSEVLNLNSMSQIATLKKHEPPLLTLEKQVYLNFTAFQALVNPQPSLAG